MNEHKAQKDISVTRFLDDAFFDRDDVVEIARDLIGKYLFTEINGIRTGGLITETEAYAGETDRASHAWSGRKTARTEIMYRDPGTLYVYLCYGIHSLVNIVTNRSGIPHAVLLRSIYPLEGIDMIKQRRGQERFDPLSLCSGPGKLSQGLGIGLGHNGLIINHCVLHVEDRKIKLPASMLRTGPRIGVDYAGKDALLPYRFYVDHRDFKNIPFRKF